MKKNYFTGFNEDTKFLTPKEIIDDGSTDSTKNFRREQNLYDHLHLKVIDTLQKYLDRCNANIVFQDADLEYDPHDLLKFENVFLKFKADGIIGSRFNYDKYTRSHSILNKIGNSFLTFIFNILHNTTFTDIYSCYFAFKKKLVNPSELKVEGFSQQAEILSKVIKNGSKFYEVPINYSGRLYSEGKKIRLSDGISIFFKILQYSRLFNPFKRI